jgi:DNA-binding NarL/FixJ family response regulator
MTQAGGMRKAVMAARNRSILRMYRNGSSVADIADALALNQSSVRQVIRAHEKVKADAKPVLAP